jgi:hypothetical protein
MIFSLVGLSVGVREWTALRKRRGESFLFCSLLIGCPPERPGGIPLVDLASASKGISFLFVAKPIGEAGQVE